MLLWKTIFLVLNVSEDAYFQLGMTATGQLSEFAIKVLNSLKEGNVHPLHQQEIFKEIFNHNNNDESMVSMYRVSILHADPIYWSKEREPWPHWGGG